MTALTEWARWVTEMFLQTDAIVLRDTLYKDADKILTVLTRTDGLLTVKAQGVRRKNAKYAACAQALSYSDMTLFSHKEHMNLKEASLLEAWLPLRDDILKMIVGVYAAEICEAVAQEGVESGELVDLLRTLLFRLCYKNQDTIMLKATFEMAVMLWGGYFPDISRCAVCGAENPPDGCLHISRGEISCRTCRDGLPPGIAMPLNTSALSALRYI